MPIVPAITPDDVRAMPLPWKLTLESDGTPENTVVMDEELGVELPCLVYEYRCEREGVARLVIEVIPHTRGPRPIPDRVSWNAARSPFDPVFGLDVVDAETGLSLQDEDIWQADQKEGWYDHFVRDEQGNYRRNEARDGILSERVHRAIRIVPRAGSRAYRTVAFTAEGEAADRACDALRGLK